jgi:ESS family glutamate:Na+ symporter
MLALDPIATLAFAGIVLFLGQRLTRSVTPLSRHNIPAPVVGGLLVAGVITAARAAGFTPLKFDTALQTPFMLAFFTTIGFQASLSLLRVGGPAVLVFLAAAGVMAVAQNVVGAGIAIALGQHPLLGVLAGSVTLTGGPATGLAFAPLFESAGIPGAETLAVAAAMVGIVGGGLIGAPIATSLIARRQLRPSMERDREPSTSPSASPSSSPSPPPSSILSRTPVTVTAADDEAYGLTKSLAALACAMALGAWLSAWFSSRGLTLPAYIGAMLVAAVLRNVDDRLQLFHLPRKAIDDLGQVALSLFLVMALMTLRLWELAGLALPLAVILAGQLILIAVICRGPIHRLMGRDYEAAVMSAGFCGFMLGTTANAMANMKSIVDRYGPAPRAFLVVPIVGAFFIDFLNALLITLCLNLMK